MTYKEAREYLIPIAANCVLPQYALALEKAMEALERAEAGEKSGRAPLIAKLRATKSDSKRQMLDEAAAAIETLEAELREERYRFERYADFSVEQSKNIDRLYAEIMED